MIGKTRKIRGVRAVIGVLSLVGCVGLAVMGTSTSVAGAKQVAGVAKNWQNKLSGNTLGWCNNPLNTACDGSATGYGTIAIVKHTFTNYDSYAPAVPGPGGQPKYARVSGSGNSSSHRDPARLHGPGQ